MVVERRRLIRIFDEVTQDLVVEQILTKVDCDNLWSDLAATKSMEAVLFSQLKSSKREPRREKEKVRNLMGGAHLLKIYRVYWM